VDCGVAVSMRLDGGDDGWDQGFWPFLGFLRGDLLRFVRVSGVTMSSASRFCASAGKGRDEFAKLGCGLFKTRPKNSQRSRGPPLQGLEALCRCRPGELQYSRGTRPEPDPSIYRAAF